MKNLRLTLLLALFSAALNLAAQEICDNGVDDDADGLIDLNDDECECDESEVALTDTVGYVCAGTLRLVMADPDAISFQWYKDGIALSGETNQLIKIFDTPGFEGYYTVLVTTDAGCYTSIPYHAFIPPPIEVDLGVQYLCPPDCIQFGSFELCSPGDFQNNAIASNGCDSITYLEVRVGNTSSYSFSDAICSGQTYEYYSISATESGVYQTVIPNNFGCDSTITVMLTVEPEIPASTNASVCAGETFQFQDIEATESGVYQTIVSGNGDCDTLLSINLTVIEPVTDTIYEEICAGATYTAHSLEASESGLYDVTLTSSDGCDSLLTIDLTVADPISSQISESICAGDTYTLYDITATETGSYSTTISNANGCDSVINVMLIVDEPISSSMEDTFCEGDTYIYYDITTTEPGSYQSVFTAANGCDSTVYVELTMLNTSESYQEEYICEGSSFSLYDIYATESGMYSTVITNSVGCDSTIYVDLTVTDTVQVFYEEAICNGDVITIRDTEYSAEGTYTIEIQDNFGCDTLITIDIEVLNESYADYFGSICEGETFEYNDISTMVSGTYETTLVNAVGCDSIVTVNVELFEHSSSDLSAEICEGEVYNLHDISATESGMYQAIVTNAAGCDSTINVDLIVNPLLRREVDYTLCEGDILEIYDLNATETGTYEVTQSNAVGCDSLITVNLVVNAPEDLLELGEDLEMDLGQTIDVIPEYISDDLYNLVWYDEDGNTLGNDRALYDYKPLVDTRIYLAGNDSNGCSVVDDILIRVELNVKVYFPNVFSPNDDGSNDEFIFKFNEAVVSIEEVLIFDRWGEHIYTAKGEAFAEVGFMGWDGTFNGRLVNPGVYVYMAKLNIVDGSQRTYSGDITVVR